MTPKSEGFFLKRIFHLCRKAPRANCGNILQWTLWILSWLFHSALQIVYKRAATPSGGHIDLLHMTTPFCMFSRFKCVPVLLPVHHK